MERLTHKRVNGIKTGYWSAASKEAVVQRLAEYENTGLTAAQFEHYFDTCQRNVDHYENETLQYERKYKQLEKRLQTIEASAPAWTPCSERPPKDGQDILAYLVNEHEARIVPANYDHGTWYDCIFNKLIPADQITHWMPSPEPPKENEDDV